MTIFKKIFLPLFSLFLLYQSIDLIRKLIASDPNELNTLATFIIAYLLTLFFTGIFAFVGFAYPTSSVLPASYYSVRKPKLIKLLYNRLGVKYFKVFLLAVFWSQKKNRKKYFDGTKEGLDNFIFQTKQSEFGHLGGFVLILIATIPLLVHQYFFMSLIMTVLNIIGNFYPIVLQRFHRIRIEKLSNRMSV